jgi:hypothetical protein
MLYEVFPFIDFEGALRPMVWVRFWGADKTWTQPIMAQIDTGSDYCLFPGEVIKQIGGELEGGVSVPVKVIGGTSEGYIHSVKMDLLRTDEDGRALVNADGNYEVVWRAPKTEMIFVAKEERGYIGVAGFLEYFQLRIDYLYPYFSLQKS